MSFREVIRVENETLLNEDDSQEIRNDVEETGNEQYDRNDHQNIVHITDSDLFMVSDMRSG